MDSDVKARVIAFIGDLDDTKLPPEQVAEANAIFKLLTRKPGRQPGFSPKQRQEAAQMLAEAGPDGKELAS